MDETNEFLEDLFPGYREYTPEESQAYHNFIDQFFSQRDHEPYLEC